MKLRIGNGIDVHPYEEGRPLFLGGVEIPSPVGLKGHSDADVLLHAITDAILGALSWGDLGQWFPNNDERYRGANSADLFLEVWKRAQLEGWALVNCDCNILAEQPKISPHMNRIKTRLAELFTTEINQVSIKATTTEELGFIGRREGMLATATVLLQCIE